MGTDIRDKSTALLTSTLEGLTSNAGGGGDASTASSQAAALESAVFTKHGEASGNEYRNEIRELSLDLGKNNTQLGQKVAEGSVSADEVVNMSTAQMQTSDRAAEDAEMSKQNLENSVADERIPSYDNPDNQLQQGSAPDGVVGAQDEAMGEEGDFKMRGQPKIKGLEGIEFETGF